MNPKKDFDTLAATWDDNPGRVALAKAITAKLLAAVPIDAASEVLDYGAGTGLVTLALAEKAGAVVAADSSDGMLTALREKLASAAITNVRPLPLDLETDHATAGPFDAIVSTMTLHHIEDAGGVVGRLAEMLRPGGRLAIADLDSDDGEFHTDPTGVRHNGFERAEIARFFAEAGLKDVAIDTAIEFEKPVPGKGSRVFSVFLATGVRR